MSTRDELEAIRARYEADPYDRSQAVADRATLLRLLDAAREELTALKRSRALDDLVVISQEAGLYGDPVLIDGDERTTVRIFTPYDPPTRAQGESS
jgi:hypothetical protein